MDTKFNQHMPRGGEKKRAGHSKNKAFKRCMAVLLSAVLTAGTCLPAMAADQPTQEQEEMSGAAVTVAEQAPEEEPALDTAEAAQEESDDEGSADSGKEAEGTDTANEISETDVGQAEEEQLEDSSSTGETEEQLDDSASTGETEEPAEPEDTEETESVIDASGETEDNTEPKDTEGTGQMKSVRGADLLTSGETSEWLQNYEYSIDILEDQTDVVRLSSYHGADTEIVVPGTATIEGIEYPVTASHFNTWGGSVERITFDTGFIFESGENYFSYAYSLRYVDLSRADLSRVTSMEWMFYDCDSLEEVIFGNADVSNVENTHSMFYLCSQLSEIDMSAFSCNSVAHYVDNMFDSCSSLRRVNLGGWDWTNVEYCYSILNGCSNLEEFTTPYANSELDLQLPIRMEDSDGNYYSYFYLPSSSITLTKLEIPEWLVGYDYELDTDNMTVRLNSYYGDAAELTVPCTATIGSKEFTVYFTYGLWGDGVTSITFEEGVLEGDSNPFYNARDLEYLDLSNISITGNSWYAQNMFRNCGKLNTICTPVNLESIYYLPKLFKDDSGNTYSMLPTNLSESITLHPADVSEWLEDYSYRIYEGMLTLEKYTGDEADVVVPGSAIVDGEEYSNIYIESGVWSYTKAVSLKLENGVTFSNMADSVFAYSPNLESIDLSEAGGVSIENASAMFYGCSNLRSLNLSGLDFSNCYYADYFLQNCDSLETIITPAEFSCESPLPAPFTDAQGNLYTYMPRDLHQSITLTRAEASEWLSDYEYDLDGNRIILKRFTGSFGWEYDEETGDWYENKTVTVPGNATISGAEYNSIVLSPNIWVDRDVTELYFDEGVVLPSDCENLFSYYSLQKIDLSQVDVSGAENMINMFGECDNLTEIAAPKNVVLDANLNGVFSDGNGNIYTSLPLSLTESITLSKTTLGNWLDDFTFSVSGKKIILTGYHGSETQLTVPGSAEIGNTVYNTVELSKFYWEDVHELSFEPGVVLPEDSSDLFEFNYDLWKLDLSRVDTSNVTNMSGMFRYMGGLEELDLSGFDTSNVTDMSSMFADSLLTSLDLSHFDTSKVTDMSYMFQSCNNLTELNLDSFDTSNVSNMESMFAFCDQLSELDVSGFDTSNVTVMQDMFLGCKQLTELDVSGFDTSKVTSMFDMFELCESLTELDVSGFNTSNVTDMSYMFAHCGRLTGLDVSGFDTSKVERTSRMFYGCDSLLELDLSSWDLHSLNYGRNMFSGTISVINAPVNVPERCGLNALYMGSDGLTYNSLPMNKDSSILLTWVSESGDPTGNLSGDPGESGDPAQGRITIVSQPEDAEVKEGEIASFHVEATGNGLQYQWQWSGDGSTWKNCTAAGFNTDTFSFTMAAKYDGRQYHCVITNGTHTVNTVAATVTLASTPEITVQPEDAFVKAGDTASFHVEASGEEVSYQWQYSLNGTKWSNCTAAGYDTDTFSFEMQEKYAGRQYRCMITADGETLTSEVATANLKESAEITMQPEDAFVRAGETASFHVEASGEEVSYQWQYSLNGTKWNNCTAAGYDTDTFSFEMQEKYAGRQYRCVITAGGEMLISEVATANLKESAEITVQPEDAYVSVGETASFHVEASGEEVIYQWQYSLNGTKWNNCTAAGYNTDTFSFEMQEKYAGRQYRCVITADGESLTSDVATANLKEEAGIIGQPEDTAVASGDTAQFHVEFSGDAPSYQWQWSSDGKVWKNCTGSSYNTDTFSFVMQAKYAGRQYRCVITAGGETYTSDSATVSLAEEALITESPVDVTVKEGLTASFHVGTSSSGVTYQWQWSSDGNTWKNCTGAGYSTDTFSFVTQSKYSGRRYRCMVTDGTKTEYSESGLLTVTK